MSVRVTSEESTAFIYDSVTGRAVGEVWELPSEAEDFLEWYNQNHERDLRSLTPDDLNSAIALWRQMTQ